MRREMNTDTYAPSIAFKRLLNDCLTLEQPGISIPQLAEQLHVRSERAYKWLDPACPSNNFPGFLLPAWTEAVGPRLLHQTTFSCGWEPSVPLAPLVSRRDVALALSEAMSSLACIARNIAPYLDGKCSRLGQMEIRDPALALISKTRQLDRWAQVA